MTSIEVAVRVRPFNAREVKYGSKLIVNMVQQNCEVSNVKNGVIAPGAPKKYTFDHCFWTHDKDGSAVYADQHHVYNAMGKKILNNSLEGFNSCLFAYGQTGSGKTYTMMGIPSDPGVIPRLCRELFHKAEELKETNAISVECSYLEIYNEQVRDLLNPAGIDKPLRVRQHPKLGVYVENLTKLITKHEGEIDKLLDDGGKVRSVAATQMNATSSRSHAILTLYIKNRNKNGELAAQLHLVDLAGSERATSTGAEGDTLMEGANINKSLTTLGMCLSRLADAQEGKKAHIPFRDSQLTWLLNDSLGGNSKTAMLANISPASINFEETLSTLRFAMTVKKIKNHAIVNEDPQQKLIRELREEIEEIRCKIRDFEAGAVAAPAPATNAPENDDAGGEESNAEEGGSAEAGGEGEENECASYNATLRGDGGTGDALANTHDSTEKEVEEEENAALPDEPSIKAPPRHRDPNAAVFEGERDASPIQVRRGRRSADHREGADDDSCDGSDEELNDDVSRPQTKEELFALLMDNTRLFAEVGQTDEEREAKSEAAKLSRARAMKALNESGVLVDASLPRLVTLNEDLHSFPSVALLYYLRQGENVVGSGEMGDAAAASPTPAAATAEDDGAGENVEAEPNTSVRSREGADSGNVLANGEGSSSQGGEHENDDGHDDDDLSDAPVPVTIVLPTVESSSATGGGAAATPVTGSPATPQSPQSTNFSVLRALVASTAVYPRHCSIIVDSLRRTVHIRRMTVPAVSSGIEDSIDPLLELLQHHPVVFVNGEPLLDDAAVQLHHLDRIFIGSFAFRHSQPITWYSTSSEDEFSRFPETLRHLEDLEHHERLECQLERERVVAALYGECGTAAKPEAAETAGEEAVVLPPPLAASLRALHEDDLQAALFRMGESETVMAERYPLTQEALARAAAMRGEMGLDLDFNFAVEEKGKRRREEELARVREAKQREIDELETTRRQQDAAIEELERELQRQTVAREKAKEQREALDATLGATATPDAGGSVSLQGTMRASTAGGQAMLLLAKELDDYEAECREAQVWKPGGPTCADDVAEYNFSTSSAATLASVTARGEIQIEVSAHKLRIKKGLFSRTGFHAVKVLVRPRFLYYFDAKADAKAAPLGAVYLYGCAIQELKKNEVVDGRKDAIRLVPCVPRKPSKSAMSPTEENNVVLAFDSVDDRQRICDAVATAALPVPPPRVAEYLRQEKLRDAESE